MKRILAIVFLILLGHASKADYLYWQVSADDFADRGIKAANYASLIAVKDGKETALAGSTGSGESGYIFCLPTGEVTVNLSTLEDATAYSFYVELLNYDSASGTIIVTGMSETKTYSQMVSGGFIDTGLTSGSAPTMWHGSGYVIPEPAGGMLVMIGLGLLGLRRRRA